MTFVIPPGWAERYVEKALSSSLGRIKIVLGTRKSGRVSRKRKRKKIPRREE